MSVTKQRPDMWRVICEAFNFTSDVIQAIEDNSADAKVRCIDLIHFFCSITVMVSLLDVIEDSVRELDPHLANVINGVKPVTNR